MESNSEWMAIPNGRPFRVDGCSDEGSYSEWMSTQIAPDTIRRDASKYTNKSLFIYVCTEVAYLCRVGHTTLWALVQGWSKNLWFRVPGGRLVIVRSSVLSQSAHHFVIIGNLLRAAVAQRCF